MDFRPPELKVALLFLVMGVMTFSGEAQQAGQPIIFSAPQTDDSQSATPSLKPQGSQLLTLPGEYQPSDSVLNLHTPSYAPAASPAIPPAQQRMNSMLLERKDWTLLTPAEIFGVRSAEKMLLPPERDAMGQEKNLSPMDRYLDRENTGRTGLTNSWQNEDRGNLPWNVTPGRDKNGMINLSGSATENGGQNLIQFLNRKPNLDNNTVEDKDSHSSWSSFSAAPTMTTAKPDLEAQAAMDRFRQFLQPSSASTAEPASGSSYFQAPKTVINPNFTQPGFLANPAGASFKPLADGIGKPDGLTPLPGITASHPPATITPSWAPKPPPWMSQAPQPFVIPQRNF